MKGTPSQVIGGCFALCAFAMAIVAGLAAGNESSAILLRAIIAMFVCYLIGLGIGMICQQVVGQQVKKLIEENPAELDMTDISPEPEDDEVLVV